MTSRAAASTSGGRAGILAIGGAADAKLVTAEDARADPAPSVTPESVASEREASGTGATSEVRPGADPTTAGSEAEGTRGSLEPREDAGTGATRARRRRREPVPRARTAAPPPADGLVRDTLDLARIALRALFAGAVTEVALTALVVLSAWWQAGVLVAPGPLLAHAVGFGLGAGLVFALADLVTRALRDASGLLLALPIALLAPLAVAGGAFELAIADGARGVKALSIAYSLFKTMLPPQAWLVVILGGVAFHGPLVLAPLRDASLPRRALATLASGALWGLAVVHLGGLPAALSATGYLTLVLLRGPVFALALAAGDRIDRRLRRREAPRGAARDRPLLVAALVLGAWAALTAGSTHARPAIALALLRPDPAALEGRLALAAELTEGATRRSAPWFGLPAAAKGSELEARAPARARTRALELLEVPARAGSWTALHRLHRVATGHALFAADRTDLLADLSSHELGGSWAAATDGGRRARFAELARWVRRGALAGDAEARAALEELAERDHPRLWEHADRLAAARDLARLDGSRDSALRLVRRLREGGASLEPAELEGAFNRGRRAIPSAALAPLGAWLRAVASTAIPERPGLPPTAARAGARREARARQAARLDAARARAHPPTRWIAAALHGGAVDAAQALAGALVLAERDGAADEAHALLALIALRRALDRGEVTVLDVRLALAHVVAARGGDDRPAVALTRAIVHLCSSLLDLDGTGREPDAAWLSQLAAVPDDAPAAGVARGVRDAIQAVARDAAERR